jgi:hypothetical protein
MFIRGDAVYLDTLLRPLVPTATLDATIERIRSDAVRVQQPPPIDWMLESPSENGEAIKLKWPKSVAAQDAIDWLNKHATNRSLAKRLGDSILKINSAGAFFIELFLSTNGRAIPPDAKSSFDTHLAETSEHAQLFYYGMLAAMAFDAWQEIERDRRRPMTAIDASRAHHDMTLGLNQAPRNLGRRKVVRSPVRIRELDQPDRYEILAPNGKSAQLLLPYDSNETIHDAIIRTLREWQDVEAVRQWYAMLCLFSVHGGRSGSARWTIDIHMDILGYAQRTRENPEARKRIAQHVQLLTKLEIAIYAPNGTLRARQPLIAVGTKYDRLNGSEWQLEGMELRINPFLYSGVRNPKTGEIGKDWFPASIELARVNPGQYPHAIGLGIILAIRWRWNWRDGLDHLSLTGTKLLEAAGIAFSRTDPGKTWNTLRNTIEELQRRDGLGRIEWDGEPWSLVGTCRLYPAQWVRDRTLHEIVPIESLPPPPIVTGAELKLWREQKGLSQATAAKILGVGQRTVRRAESEPKKPLGPAIREAMANYGRPETLQY